MSPPLARVARIDRGAADLLTDSGNCRIDIPPGSDLAVGDWVTTNGLHLLAIEPRRTAIVRAAASGESRAQILVANVDTVFVAVPAVPAPRPAAVERLVALAWDSGATPVVLLTKSDLAVAPQELHAAVAGSAPGCDVHAVSAETGDGMPALAAYDEPGRTLCVIGRSGAGKSTLANALHGEVAMEVSNVRRDGKGRHTTTHRQLIPLPGGAVLIDTPGLRGVGLWIADEGVAAAFPDIDSLATGCRFSDCAHDTEPGCAVTAAIASGELPRRRLESWRKLEREAAWIAARSDARLRKERQRQWRQTTMAARRSGPFRP